MAENTMQRMFSTSTYTSCCQNGSWRTGGPRSPSPSFWAKFSTLGPSDARNWEMMTKISGLLSQKWLSTGSPNSSDQPFMKQLHNQPNVTINNLLSTLNFLNRYLNCLHPLKLKGRMIFHFFFIFKKLMDQVEFKLDFFFLFRVFGVWK